MGLVVNEYGKVLGLVTMDDVLAQLFGALRDERDALQSLNKRGGRGGRTPVPGVSVRTEPPGTPVFDTGPVGRVDPPELTPPPQEVPFAIAALASRRSTTAPEDDPALAAHPPGPTGDGDREGGGSAEPSRRLRASTKDEDDAELDGHSGDRGNGTPVPITDNDTGPSGPISVGGRR